MIKEKLTEKNLIENRDRRTNYPTSMILIKKFLKKMKLKTYQKCTVKPV